MLDHLEDAAAGAKPIRRPRGRPATAGMKAGEIVRLRAAHMRAVDIARRLEISRASVYRILDDARRSMVTIHGPTSP